MGKYTDDKASQRMTNHDIGSRDMSVLQQSMQLFSKLGCIAWKRACIAPAQAGSIVRTDAGRLRHFWLYNASPRCRPITQSRNNHHGGAARTSTVYVQAITANINQLARRWIGPCIRGFCQSLVNSPYQRQTDNHNHNPA